MAKCKIGAPHNQSPSVGGYVGAALTEAAGKAVKYDATGSFVLTEAGTDSFVGVLSMETPDAVALGDSVTVFTNNVTVLAEAGGVIAAGDFVTAGAGGTFTKAATDGDVVAGQATTAAGAAGRVFWLEISKSYK